MKHRDQVPLFQNGSVLCVRCDAFATVGSGVKRSRQRRRQATNASGLKLAAFGMTAAGSVPIQFPSSSV